MRLDLHNLFFVGLLMVSTACTQVAPHEGAAAPSPEPSIEVNTNGGTATPTPAATLKVTPEASAEPESHTVEHRDFTVLALNADTNDVDISGSLVVKTTADSVSMIRNDAKSWKLTESDRNLTVLDLTKAAFLTGAVYTVDEEAAWIVGSDAFSRTTPAINDSLYSLPLVRIAFADIWPGDTTNDVQVVGSYPADLFIMHGGHLYQIDYASNALSAVQISAPTRAAGAAAFSSAGLCKAYCTYWLWASDGLYLARQTTDQPPKMVWEKSDIVLTFPATATLSSMALQIGATTDTPPAPTVVGAAYGISGSDLLVSAEAAAPIVIVTKYTWTADILHIATQYCTQCHDNLKQESGWWAESDLISQLVAVSFKSDPSSMPQANSAPALAIPDSARRKIVSWLAAGQTP